jgi:hypothetical protein
MTWAPTEVQKAVYALLKNDATLMTALGSSAGATNRIFDSVPDNQACPYVTLQIKPTTARGNESKDGVQLKIYCHVWYDGTSQGDLPVQTLQKRIDELLHDQTNISISGWNVISLQREMIDIRQDPDGRTKHGIQIFNLMVGEQ